MTGKSILSGLLLLHVLSATVMASGVELFDVTSHWIFRYTVVSAFPKTYDRIPKEENADIIAVFHYQVEPLGKPAGQRRIEVFYTGGDWMNYGLTYVVSNAENVAHSIFADGSAAYFIPKLSTPDRENGAVPPEIDPKNIGALKNYLTNEFLDQAGKVNSSAFIPIDE